MASDPDDAYYEALDESADTGRYRSGASTGGPWAEGLQHGGPPNALLVHAAERLVVAETGRSDLVALRLAADFVGPVPVAELDTSARLVRAARSAALVEVVLRSEGRDCLHGRVWFVRDADTSAVAAAGVALTPPESGTAGMPGGDFPYGRSIEWQVERGGLAVRGPGAVWARPRVDLIGGRPYTGLQRAALIGDSASGISSELDWSEWSFVNVDLAVHLARPVRGEWLHMAAVTRLGAHGSALARSELSDSGGTVGSTAQTLVLAPLRH